MLLNPMFHIFPQNWSTCEFYPPSAQGGPYRQHWLCCLSLALCMGLGPEACPPAPPRALHTTACRAQFLVLPPQQSPNFLAPLLRPKRHPLLPIYALETESSAWRAASGQSLWTHSCVRRRHRARSSSVNQGFLQCHVLHIANLLNWS